MGYGLVDCVSLSPELPRWRNQCDWLRAIRKTLPIEVKGRQTDHQTGASVKNSRNSRSSPILPWVTELDVPLTRFSELMGLITRLPRVC